MADISLPLMGGGGVVVILPRTLRNDGPGPAEVGPGTLADVVATLDGRYPGLAHRVLDDRGIVRGFVSVFVNEALVREDDPGRIVLRAGDTVHILPSIAGGRG
jgi:molybdopterin converting factor small subunit